MGSRPSRLSVPYHLLFILILNISYVKVCILIHDRKLLLSSLVFELCRALLILVPYKCRPFVNVHCYSSFPSVFCAFSSASLLVFCYPHNIIDEPQCRHRMFSHSDSLVRCLYCSHHAASTVSIENEEGDTEHPSATPYIISTSLDVSPSSIIALRALVRGSGGVRLDRSCILSIRWRLLQPRRRLLEETATA